MTAKQFSRNEFLKGLDRFYTAIELAAANTQDYQREAALPELRSTSASSRASRPRRPTPTASSTRRSPSWTSWCAASKTS